MSCIPRRKGRRNCGLMNGEAGIVVPHDQPSVIYSSDTDNPLLVDRIYVNFIYTFWYQWFTRFYFSCTQTTILYNSFTNSVVIYPCVYSVHQKYFFLISYLLLLQGIDVVHLFAVKQFEVISLCEMKLLCSWWSNK
jgi:hypothetical protein